MKTKSLNIVDKHIGTRLRTRRMVLKMSQTELGRALGLTFQQVHRYEKGKNHVGAGRLQAIAKVLQVPIEYFFEGAPSPQRRSGKSNEPALDFVAASLATKEGLALTEAFAQIKRPQLRRVIVRLVRDLANNE